MTFVGSRTRPVAVVLLGALLVARWADTDAQPAREASRESHAALADLPDWSGWWGHPMSRPEAASAHPPPLKPEVLAAARAAGPDADPLRYCRPWQFTGESGGFTEAVEFLFTPGRVTLTNERGLIRRIYTGGQAIPADLDPTNTGLSVGHWEGQTLVVETTHINPRAAFPGAGRTPIGKDVRITERMRLTDADTLELDIETIAPDVLTGPYRVTQLYKRLQKSIASEITWCTEFDRSIEPNSGKQRFDMTPPPDLPPPPPRR
jgi:hypothetical protein